MGTFYALSGQGGRRGWINWFLSAAGVMVMTPSLAMTLSGDTGAETAVVVGSILAILGMLTFLVSILATWRATLA